MKKAASVLVFVSCVLFVQNAPLRARESQGSGPRGTTWPTHGWAKSAPTSVGLEEKVLAGLDADLATGKYPMVDSFAVFRCGSEVFERTYSHDYGTIYAKEAKTRGPLNARLTGPYNYFDPAWHPYYHGTDLHSMQSVSKTVSSIIVGIAVTRGDFKASLDTPLLKYFDGARVKNVDERKRRITLRHVLTMSTGLDWNEEVAYDDPRNDADLMEATDDWVQYVIDRPLAKMGYLYLHDGMWDGQQIVSKDWVKQSLAPFIDAEEGFKYGFKWWLLPRTDRQGYVWMARGFGGQRLMVFPEEDMIVVFTGWEILKDPAGDRELVNRILPAVRTQSCTATQ